MEFLIDNILPVRVPGLLAAVGGLGKSYILLDLCMKVAGGDQSLHKEQALGGTILKNGKVVFLGAEDSADSIHRRIESIAGPNLAERAAGNLFVVPSARCRWACPANTKRNGPVHGDAAIFKHQAAAD